MRDDGAEPTITEGQDNRVHIKSHIGAMVAGLQSVQQGGDPVSVLTFIPVALAHTGKHLSHLPREEQRGWTEQLREIQGVYQDLASQYQQVQEQQAKLQERGAQLGFEQRLQAMELDADIARKDRKQAAQLEQRQQGHEQKVALADASTSADIQRQTATTATDIAAKQAKTAADIEAQRAKTAAQAEAARNKPKGGA